MRKAAAKTIITFILLLEISFLWGPLTSHAAPNLVNYQGSLADSGGTPVPDGDYSMIFRIFDDATSTDPLNKLWEETQTVSVANGIYNVLLGSGTPTVGSFDPLLFSSNNRWLEVEVNGEVLGPRQAFSRVPYTRRAVMADTVVDGSVTAAKIGEGCAIGEILVKTASGWACGAEPYKP